MLLHTVEICPILERFFGNHFNSFEVSSPFEVVCKEEICVVYFGYKAVNVIPPVIISQS